MRFSLLLAFASCLTSAFASTVHAQGVVASNGAAVSTDGGSSGDATANSTDEVVLAGKITNPAGPLPGAVIILKGTKQMAVTNAEGEFQLVVPASAGELEAVVTYAGYADEKLVLNAAASESTVSLTNARVIVVSRKQQLKTYLRTARKQVKRDLKQARE